MYLKNEFGYPCAGAPAPKFAGPGYANVCWVCFTMISTISDKAYWRVLHDLWKSQRIERKRKLGEGGQYI